MFTQLIARLKHLPGKHNQASHGHKGPAGSASRAAYTAARAGGASHREALDKGKLASQQIREQMRTERRAQVEARRAERAANPKPKQATSPRTETPIDTRPLISVDTAQKHNNRIMSLKNNLALAEKDKAFALAQLPKIEAQYAGDTSDLAVYKLKQARLNVASAQERIDRANQGIARFSQTPPEGRAYTTANNPEIKAYAEQMGIPDHEGFVFTDQWKGEIKSLAAQGFRKPKEAPKAETPQTMRARQLVDEGHRMWEGGDKQRVYINDPRIRNLSRGGIYYDVKTGTWHQQEPMYSGSNTQRRRQQEEWNAIVSEYQQRYMK